MGWQLTLIQENKTAGAKIGKREKWEKGHPAVCGPIIHGDDVILMLS